MSTVITPKITPQGVLIPREAMQGWPERGVEVIKSEKEQQIIIRPKSLSEPLEREAIARALHNANITSPLDEPLSQQASAISPTRRAELAQALAVGKPLSEIVIEERTERW